ncbi:MAG TPA: hypothetical protein VII56_07575 [Rhizomicrobium sp.]
MDISSIVRAATGQADRRKVVALAALVLAMAVQPCAAQVPGVDTHPQAAGQIEGSDCLGSSYAPLAQRAAGLVPHSLLTTTQLIGAGSQTQVVLSGVLGAGDLSQLHLRTFFVDPHVPEGSYAPPVTEARLVASNLSAAEQKPIAQNLQIKEDDNALLQMDVPRSANGELLPRTRRVVVVACLAGKLAPVLWANAEVKISSSWSPVVGGILITLFLYVFCAFVVHWARDALIEEQRTMNSARDKKAQEEQDADPDAEHDKPPEVPLPTGRLATVTPWSWLRCLNPVALTSDIFDKGSLGNLQVLFFTLLVSYGLIYIVFQTGELSSISTTVVELLGISAIGSLGAKAVGTTKNRLSTENWAWLVSRGVLPLNDPGKGKPRWRDLIMSDSELDLYKVQALVFSLIVGMGMIVGGFRLATFSVPNELLEVLGLSQMVFVGGRAVKPASMSDLDVLLTELRTRETALRKAAVTGCDVDNTGTPVGKASAKAPFKTMEAAGASDGVPNAVLRYTETLSQVKILLDAWSHREVNAELLKKPPLA